MTITTRDEICTYLAEETAKFSKERLENYSTLAIANSLSLSRSLVSMHLNELAIQEILIKINTRPVYFLHKEVLQQMLKVKFTQIVFQKADELFYYLDTFNAEFAALVGYQGVLYESIEQVKVALRYPKGGLPIWIEGEAGCGKTLFTKAIEQYAVSEHLADVKTIYRLDNSMKSFSEEFNKAVRTSKEKCNKLIIIDHMEKISEEQERNLITYMMDRESLQGHPIQPQMVFTSLPISESSSPLKRLIPIIIKLPPYQSYSFEEKAELIARFLEVEESRIQKHIKIMENVLNHLCAYVFPDHIDGLKTELAQMCAKAYRTQSGNEDIILRTVHFSPSLLQQFDVDERLDSNLIISIQELIQNQRYDWLQAYLITAVKRYDSYKKRQLSFDVLCKYLQTLAKDCHHEVFYRGRISSSHISMYSSIVENACLLLERRYQYAIPSSLRMLLSGFIYLQGHDRINMQYQQQLLSLREEIFNQFPSDASVCMTFSQSIEANIGIMLNDFFLLIMLFSLQEFNLKRSRVNKTIALILCHGYATASSMANAVNTLIGEYVYDAVDMPLESTIMQVIEILKLRIEKEKYIDKFLFLVDMGSLEKVDEGLKDIPNISIGIINGVSTGLALEIGYKLLANEEITSIIEQIKTEHIIQPKLIMNKRKEDAILFVGDAQASVAEHLRDLFLSSLPINISLKTLVASADNDFIKTLDTIKKEYNVKHVIGVLDRKLKEIDYLDITEMMELRKDQKIYQTLSQYLQKEDMEMLRMNLIKNYSLQNIVEHLTILNPYILINEIELFLNNIQIDLAMKLDIKSRFGLYVHLAILVERLVTHSAIECFKAIEVFEQEQAEFIKAVKRCFRNIENQYKIELPVSEIAYIYDFFEAQQKEN